MAKILKNIGIFLVIEGIISIIYLGNLEIANIEIANISRIARILVGLYLFVKFK